MGNLRAASHRLAAGTMLLATGGPRSLAFRISDRCSWIRPLPCWRRPHAVDGAALVGRSPSSRSFGRMPTTPFEHYSAARSMVIWIVDAGANAVTRYDGRLRGARRVPEHGEPTRTTPPTSQAVPTRIVPDGDGGAYVVQLTDSRSSMARQASSASQPTATTPPSPRDSRPWSTSKSPPTGASSSARRVTSTRDRQPAPGTGSVIRVRADGSFDTFIADLWLPTGVEVVEDDVYVTQFVLGTVTKYEGIAPQPCVGDLNGDGRRQRGRPGSRDRQLGLCP